MMPPSIYDSIEGGGQRMRNNNIGFIVTTLHALQIGFPTPV